MTTDAFLKYACIFCILIAGLLSLDLILPSKNTPVIITGKQKVVNQVVRGRIGYSDSDIRISTSEGAILVDRSYWTKIQLGEGRVLESSRLFNFGISLSEKAGINQIRNTGTIRNTLFFFPPGLFILSLLGYKKLKTNQRRELAVLSIVLLFFLLLLTMRDFFA